MNFEKYVSPEAAGIPSEKILEFIQYLENKKMCMHNIMLLHRGKIVFEAHYPPFTPDSFHRMYSVTKSFVSMAVGFMIDEGKISLDDRVIKYFPEYLNDNINEYQNRATIRDMLKMTDCHTEPLYGFIDEDWIRTWFDKPATHPAGMVFSYNTCCTNMCCAIVEKLSGMSFIDYLYPRLFEPVGASKGITCIKTPEGYSFGGSGVLATPLDLALVMQVCLNNGAWQGKQLISEGYIREATSYLVDNSVTGNNIDERQGYGYQFWRTRHNGFACYGMGSQYAICLPDHDMVIVTTADTQGTTNAGYIVHEAIFSNLLPVLKDEPLQEDLNAQSELYEYNSSLELPLVPGKMTSPIAEQISGVRYDFNDNPFNIKNVKFDFYDDEVTMTYEKPNGIHKLRFGIGKLIEQPFPETHYSGMQIGVPAGYGYESRAGAAWSTENCLNAKVYVTDDYLGSFSMNAVFKENEITIIMSKIAEDFLHDYMGTATGNKV